MSGATGGTGARSTTDGEDAAGSRGMAGRRGDVAPATDAGHPAGATGGRWWLAGLAISALVVILLAPMASPDPDGLERVAEDAGFLERAQAAIYQVLPAYAVPGVDNATLSTVIAGLIGVAVVFGLMWLLGRLLVRRDPRGG